MNYEHLAQMFLAVAKNGKDPDEFAKTLGKADPKLLIEELDSDEKKKAFWINIYNGYIIMLLNHNPDLYLKRSSFFQKKRIVIAGRKLSFDNIEHGILRRSKIKWSMGILTNPFDLYDKKWRVVKTDFRIHFALNCGAASCPPIHFYKSKEIDEQLNLATHSYLEAEVKLTQQNVYVPMIMWWFLFDFGGYAGIRKILREYGIINAEDKPGIRFNKYNWTLQLKNK